MFDSTKLIDGKSETRLSYALVGLFSVFGFVTLSSLGGAALISLLSWSAVLVAGGIFIHYKCECKNNTLLPYESVGLWLFFWLALSIGWSGYGSVNDGLAFLSEYRVFILVPFLSIVLSVVSVNLKFQARLIFLALGLSLCLSYLIATRIIDLGPDMYSMKNRIFHGFLMCLLFAMTAIGFLHSKSKSCWPFLPICLLSSGNVFFIEVGRTAYIAVIAITLALAVLHMREKRSWVLVFSVFSLLAVGGVTGDRFASRLADSANNVERYIEAGDATSSAGMRLNWYQSVLQESKANLVLGVGLADYEFTLKKLYRLGTIKKLTDNIHSEPLNMLLVGGLPALGLYLAFLVGLAWQGLRYGFSGDKRVRDAYICLACLLLVHSTFNSTFKDFGEKHVLVYLLPILGAWGREIVRARMPSSA